MAVYQGARPPSGIALPWLRPGLLPRRETEKAAPRPAAAATSRRRAAAPAARRRARPTGVGLVLAAIVVAFSVAFLSLSQSVRVAATSYDIVRLTAEHDRLAALQLDLRSDVERLKSEPAIRKEALDAGLGQLGPAIVLPAR
jgi:cell division protein FtsB